MRKDLLHLNSERRHHWCFIKSPPGKVHSPKITGHIDIKPSDVRYARMSIYAIKTGASFFKDSLFSNINCMLTTGIRLAITLQSLKEISETSV